jgi:hypothetical protein
MKMIIAVDCGVNGGISWTHGEQTEAVRMPPTDADICALIGSLSCRAKDIEIYIEEPPLFVGRNIPGSAVGKMMMNFGLILGASIACGFRVHRVRPATWMKTHPIGTKGDLTTTQWKNKLKGRASELYPNADVTLATADSLLILDSARRGAIN